MVHIVQSELDFSCLEEHKPDDISCKGKHSTLVSNHFHLLLVLHVFFFINQFGNCAIVLVLRSEQDFACLEKHN